MNAMGHTVPGTPQMGTLTRNGSHRSVRGGRSGQTAPPSTSIPNSTPLPTQQTQSAPHQQPDILKSTPDHQSDRLHRTDSKKRAHLDSGVA